MTNSKKVAPLAPIEAAMAHAESGLQGAVASALAAQAQKLQAVVERLFHGDKLAAHKARIAIGDALRDPGKFDPRKVETQSIDFDDPREWKK